MEIKVFRRAQVWGPRRGQEGGRGVSAAERQGQREGRPPHQEPQQERDHRRGSRQHDSPLGLVLVRERQAEERVLLGGRGGRGGRQTGGHQAAAVDGDGLPNQCKLRECTNAMGVARFAHVWLLCVPSLPVQTATGLDRKDQELVDQLAAKNVKGVHFDERQNRWVASWREGGKLHSKTFAINKHGGIEEAYDKAVACRKAAEASGAASIQQPGERQSGHTGVSWHKQSKAWMASWRDVSGKQQCRYFPVSSWGGDSEAKAAAIRCREKMVEQTKREKQDRQVSSRKRPSGATESRRVRRRVK
mmetsp:Transcript_18650/g.53388  ORF Transcript_18650/g.53388 Transcript_18650/m.53388 type:complete len:303 (-) Transcript_18650:1847-2755(-)